MPNVLFAAGRIWAVSGASAVSVVVSGTVWCCCVVSPLCHRVLWCSTMYCYVLTVLCVLYYVMYCTVYCVVLCVRA